MNYGIRFGLLLLLLLGSTPQTLAISTPTIDGAIDNNEWDSAARFTFELTNGKFIELYTYYTQTDLYFLLILEHNSPGDEIVFDTSIPHDYIGIEFDNNFDSIVMGHASSPDDMIMIDYERGGYQDMYMHSFKAFWDVDNGGMDNGEGESGQKSGEIIWEFRKPLNSGDSLGYDISLDSGDEFRVMLAFWDNKPPHSANGFTNTFNENALFIPFFVGEIRQQFLPNFLTLLTIFVPIARTIQINKSSKLED